MDYDAYVIAEVYDKARAPLPATARLWQELLADYMVPGTTSLILDLGFSELLARRFGGHVIGIDPSEGMLQQVLPGTVQTTGTVALHRTERCGNSGIETSSRCQVREESACERQAD